MGKKGTTTQVADKKNFRVVLDRVSCLCLCFPRFHCRVKTKEACFGRISLVLNLKLSKHPYWRIEWTLDRIFSEMVMGMNEKCENNDDFYSDVDDEADEEHVQEEGIEEMVVMMEMMMVEETGRSVHGEIRVAIGARAGGEEEHFAWRAFSAPLAQHSFAPLSRVSSEQQWAQISTRTARTTCSTLLISDGSRAKSDGTLLRALGVGATTDKHRFAWREHGQVWVKRWSKPLANSQSWKKGKTSRQANKARHPGREKEKQDKNKPKSGKSHSGHSCRHTNQIINYIVAAAPSLIKTLWKKSSLGSPPPFDVNRNQEILATTNFFLAISNQYRCNLKAKFSQYYQCFMILCL